MSHTPDAATAPCPVAIPHDRVIEIANLSAIPDQSVIAFEEELRGLLIKANSNFIRQPELLKINKQIEEELESLAKAASKLVDALANLNGASRYELAKRTNSPDNFFFNYTEAQEGIQHLDNLALHIEKLRDAARPKRKIGAPRRREKFQPLDTFIEALERKIIVYGGKTTFNKNDGSGTLAEILRILAPYLPAGFIRQGDRRIYDVKTNTGIWWRSLIAELDKAQERGAGSWARHSRQRGSDALKQMERSFATEIGNAVLLSGRLCHFRRVGRTAAEEDFWFVAPREDGRWLSRNWTKIPWKRA